MLKHLNNIFLIIGVIGVVWLFFTLSNEPVEEEKVPTANFCKEEAVEDLDGNVYGTVSIGRQCWMAENLKTTVYRDGTPIPKIEDHNEWWNDTEGSYALYDHTYPFRYIAKEITSDEEMFEVYGLLYNFYAVSNPSGLCPEGWRVPSDEDWQELEVSLGISVAKAQERWHRGVDEGSRLAGKVELWGEDGIKTKVFGDSGFDALPAGYRRSYGDYGNISSNANFWTSDEKDENNAMSREIYAGNAGIYRIDNINKNNGHSVRCIQK